jgi:hypothetical protein
VSEVRRLIGDNLGAARRVAARLRRSVERVAALGPFTADLVAGLDPDQAERVDAFLKRFEQLADLVGVTLFKGLAILEQEDAGHLSRRDLADLMEKLGAIASAEQWSRVAVLRNRLAHGYPNDPGRQASRLREALDVTPVALVALESLERYLAGKPGSAGDGLP